MRLRAAQWPATIAHQVAGAADLTYGRWDAASDAAAHGLRARGVTPGSRVLLNVSSRYWTDYAIAWAGALKAGAVAVPVSPSAGREQATAAFHASRAVLVVGDSDLVDADRCTVADLLAGQPNTPLAVPVSPTDDAEIIYTSGTTGVPKGVVATHENLLFPLMRSRASRPRTALHALPPGTTVGQGLLVQPLGPSPHRTLTLPQFVPAEVLEAIARYRPTDLVLVPAMAIALISAGARQRYDLSSVEQVRTTSAPIHPATLQALAELFPTARIRNVYSTTECWPRRMATDYDRDRPRSLGRPAAGSEVRIVLPDGDVAPPGVAGDVQLRSDAPQRRYDGESTDSAVFLDGGWTRTGDIGLVDAEGYFYLVDRNPDLVNTGGLNVSTLDVEASLMEFPGVVEAAVCGVPHPVLTECVMAAVRARPGLDVAALQEFARERQGAAAPLRIVMVDDMPRNMIGKVDKRQLRKDLEQYVGARPYEPPRTPTEIRAAQLWSVALDLDQISASDDFLQLGGASLAAMEVVSELSEELGRKVTVRDLLDSTSLRQFAARVDAAPAAGDDELLDDGRSPSEVAA
ncbi:AMP-binding protein [Dactylosporangium sp. CA-139066]|uniref:AMP-binding protein n=1 Tax=Dactylosporangium sp. CA-139066 TaxID=3239930 RepID=UPI003D8D092D